MYKLIIQTTQTTPTIIIKSPILNTINLITKQQPISPQSPQSTIQHPQSHTKIQLQQIPGWIHLLRNLNTPQTQTTLPLKQKSCALLILNLHQHNYIQQLLQEQLTQIQYLWRIKQDLVIPVQKQNCIGCNQHGMVVFKSIALAQEFYQFVEVKFGDCVVFYVESVVVGVVGKLGEITQWGVVLDEEKDWWVEIPHCEKCLEILESDVTGISQKYTKTPKQQIQMMPIGHACRVCWIRSRQQSRCSGCQQIQDNWVCMVCGTIGCGRYKNADAFKHYSTSKHILSLDLKTNRIWNYKLDCFSHRIVGKDGLLQEQNRDIKFDMDFDDDRVQAQFWKYCNVVSQQLDRQRNFYNCIKEEEIQRYTVQQKILVEKLETLNKIRQEKKQNLKKKLKKNKKLAKRFTELQEECKQQRELSKILEESAKNKDKYEKKQSEIILKKKQQLRRLEQEIEKLLVSLEAS